MLPKEVTAGVVVARVDLMEATAGAAKAVTVGVVTAGVAARAVATPWQALSAKRSRSNSQEFFN